MDLPHDWQRQTAVIHSKRAIRIIRIVKDREISGKRPLPETIKFEHRLPRLRLVEMQRSAVHSVNQGAIDEELTARAEVPNIGLQRQPNQARFGQAKPASPDGAGDSLLVVNHQHRAVLQFHRGRVGAKDRINGMRTRPGSSVVTANMQRCLRQPMSQENLTASQPREMRAMA